MSNPFKKLGDKVKQIPGKVDPRQGHGHGFNPDPRKALDKVEHLPDEALKEIPKLVGHALEELVKEAQRGALRKAVNVLEAEVPDDVSLTIGPVGLDIPDVRTRFDAIRRWANNPPANKNDIRHMIEDLAPASVSITLSSQLAIVFVSSSSLSLGMTMTWPTAEFLKRLDGIWSRLS